MSPKNQKKRIKYPYSTSRAYLSAMMAAASVILTLVVLNTPTLDPILTLYYIVVTILMTAIIFSLKTRSFFTEKLRIKQEKSVESEPESPRRITLVLMFFILIIVLMAPLFLINFLEPEIWFIGLFSFISSINIAEIFFYIYTR